MSFIWRLTTCKCHEFLVWNNKMRSLGIHTTFITLQRIHKWFSKISTIICRWWCYILLTGFATGSNLASFHYGDVIISAMASQITSITIVCATVYSGADQRKHQSSASLAFVWRIHWWPVNSPHKGPVTRKMFPFDDVIMPCKWDFYDTKMARKQFDPSKSEQVPSNCF